MFNGVRRLACQTLWCLFLREDEKVGESCMTYMQSGYNDLFHSWFSKCWSPFSQSGLDLEELIINAIIPALLSFCNKEPIYLCFKSVYGMLVLSGLRSKADFAAESALSLPLTPMWLGIQDMIISLWLDIEFSLFSSLIINGFSSILFFNDVNTENESENVKYLLYLFFDIILRARSIAQIAAIKWSFP